MKSSIVVRVVLAASLAATLLLAPSASASSIFVTTKYEEVDICMPAPDTVRWAFEFSAKIRRRGVAKPRKVVIDYTVTDRTTGQEVLDERVILRPNKYRKKGSPVNYVAEHTYDFKFISTYRVPGSGRKVTAKTSDTITIAAAADLATRGFPACV